MNESGVDLYLFITSGVIILAILAGFIAYFIVAHEKKQRQNKIEGMRMRSEYDKQLLQTQLEIQEQTLKNISQEIHDNVGQVLSLAKLNLNMMDMARPELLQGKIDNTLSQVTKAINDLRDLSKSFNSDTIIAQGLIKAIAFELEIIHKSGSHHTEFRITGNSGQLEPQKELILFRIVQEALHNIIKHAGATTVKVIAEYIPGQLQLCVCDNGKGFNLAPLNEAGNTSFGLGIRNMHNRAKMIGADFNISSTPGAGTTVKILLSLNNQAADQ
jgi:two-component system, NarL family, sensor kinase